MVDEQGFQSFIYKEVLEFYSIGGVLEFNSNTARAPSEPPGPAAGSPPPLSAVVSKQAELGWLMNRSSRVLFNEEVLDF